MYLVKVTKIKCVKIPFWLTQLGLFVAYLVFLWAAHYTTTSGYPWSIIVFLVIAGIVIWMFLVFRAFWWYERRRMKIVMYGSNAPGSPSSKILYRALSLVFRAFWWYERLGKKEVI